MNLSRSADSAYEPVTLDEVKRHLRITEDDDDAALQLFITSTRQKLELYLGKTLITTSWQAKYDHFPTMIELPMAPVKSIESVQYYDADNALQTLDPANYEFDEYGRFRASSDSEWPETFDRYGAVIIDYTSGEDSVDADLKHAMLLIIGSADAIREGVVVGATVTRIPEAAESLLAPHRKMHR